MAKAPRTVPRISEEKKFILHCLDEIPVPDELSQGEKELLRELAQPGMPLWKIFRSMLDYREGLKEGLVMADDDDPEIRAATRKIKATIQGIDWVMDTFESALSSAEARGAT